MKELRAAAEPAQCRDLTAGELDAVTGGTVARGGGGGPDLVGETQGVPIRPAEFVILTTSNKSARP
jgi:hypothetical protein